MTKPNWRELIGLIFEKEVHGTKYKVLFYDCYGDVECEVRKCYIDSDGITREATIFIKYHVNKDYKNIEDLLNDIETAIKEDCTKFNEVIKIFEKFGWKLIEWKDC